MKDLAREVAEEICPIRGAWDSVERLDSIIYQEVALKAAELTIKRLTEGKVLVNKAGDCLWSCGKDVEANELWELLKAHEPISGGE